MGAALPPVCPQNGHFFLVLVVIGLLDNIMPLALRYIHKEDFSGLMALDSILEFFRHHFLPEEPARVAMRGIAIHRVLIGELVEGNALGQFLLDKFF